MAPVMNVEGLSIKPEKAPIDQSVEVELRYTLSETLTQGGRWSAVVRD